MTIVWCLLAFAFGLAIGWAIFKPSDDAENDYEEDSYDYSRCNLDYGTRNDNPADWPDGCLEDKCNGCIHLKCTSLQDDDEYSWHCKRSGDWLCTTKEQTGTVPRPLGCHDKDG